MALPKVLIVEDEVVAATNLEILCNQWGYSVCPLVTSAEEAVESAEHEAPDIILMDINIHGDMDGIEAAAEIRRCSDIPVIFVSGYTDDRTLTCLNTIENSVHIQKPIDFVLLRETMKRLLA